VLSYPAAIPLSNRTLVRLGDLIREHRVRRRSRWRRLDPGRQALLVLAHLRNGDIYARLAAGFDISSSTAWRYIGEAVDLLAALADDIGAAGARAARPACAILDGTLIPIDRVADQKPYYSGKHRRHGVNVQIVADPAGRLAWASAALPGAVHDPTAARTHGLGEVLTATDVTTFADKAYHGAGGTVRTPFTRHRARPRLSCGQKAVNRAHARIRALGDRAVSLLKGWKVLATIAAAAACSGDSCRPGLSLLRELTRSDVITHSTHPAGPQAPRVGPETPILKQSRLVDATGITTLENLGCQGRWVNVSGGGVAGVLLRSHDRFVEVGWLEVETGDLLREGRSDGDTVGWYDRLDDEMVFFYAHQGEMWLQTGRTRIPVTGCTAEFDRIAVRGGEDRVLRVLREGTVVFTTGYHVPNDPVLPHLLYITAGAEEEDFDLGMFIANVINDPVRLARMRECRVDPMG
jgi:hypothetical protein